MKPARFSFLLLLAASIAQGHAEEPRAKAAVGVFASNDVPAADGGSALLTIPAAGRYAIRGKSASGARIELVDMIAGPGESAGAAGLRDGRIDALLDKGVYKIRVSAAKGAAGKVHLSADPFVEPDGKRPALGAAQIASSDLADMQQRSFALDVGADGLVAVEAMGRALQDLRLWRADGELVDLAAQRSSAEPRPGRPMTRLRLEGKTEPGKYVVTAYGGESIVWAEGDSQKPLYLRIAVARPLVAGIAEGVVGPFGSVYFTAPAGYDAFHLQLVQQTTARLEARRGGAHDVGAILKNSREPAASAFLPGDGRTDAALTVSAYEGQRYTLRALRRDSRLSFEGVGPHLVAVDVAGESPDDPPATALFARVEKDSKARVLASDLPRIPRGGAWRGKFNLRATTSLLVEAQGDGPLQLDVKGLKVSQSLAPALGALQPSADPKQPGHYDVRAGFYLLTLTPWGDTAGVVDVTLGAPGAAANIAPPPPPRSLIDFGSRHLDSDGSYLLLTNVAPGLVTGPRVTPLPVDLAKAPLPLMQGAKDAIELAVKLPKSGKVAAWDSKGAAIAVTLENDKTENDVRTATVKISPAGAVRALGLVLVPGDATEETAKGEEKGESAPAKSEVKPTRAPLVAAIDKPAFFDLARDETKQVRFSLSQGGLYRVETLGRLQTALAVGTSFSPRIGEGDNNGAGHNGLVTTYLRAGAWRAAVTAKESSGHLGLAVTPAALTATAKLVDAGDARAALGAGKGAAVPFEITKAGSYRLDLLGVGRTWRARLEDSEGWPLTPPGPLTTLTRDFDKGAYRVVVLPEDVDARMALRLTPIVAPPALEGHGPHVLPFDAAQRLQWREPQGRDAPRAPDVWTFALVGAADVELSIGEGMVGELFRGKDSIGKIAGDRPYKGKLAAGDYRLEAKSLAHDDRLDYAVTLRSKELQPGVARRADLPATFTFAIENDRIVDLSSFGDRDIFAVLKDAKGDVVERLGSGAADWNLALSRRLPAGVYTLEARDANGGASTASSEGEAAAAATEGDSEADDKHPLFRLALPQEKDEGALPCCAARSFTGADAHVVTLEPPREGRLQLVAAKSDREIAVSIEKRDGGGWRSIGVERGLEPVAAWPDEKGEWRAVVWPIGGGAAALSLSARALDPGAQSPGDISFEAVDGASACIAAVRAPSAALTQIEAPQSGLYTGLAPGRLLRPVQPGSAAPQSDRLWLMLRGDCRQHAKLSAFSHAGGETAIDLGAGDVAGLPASTPPSGKTRLLLARSAFGQPGLRAAGATAIAANAALAQAGDGPAQLFEAGEGAPLRATVRAIDVELRDRIDAGALFSGLVPPMSALPVSIDKAESLEVDLAPGLALFSAPGEKTPLAAFTDDAALSRRLSGAAATLWLVNIGEAPAPARIAARGAKAETLDASRAVKRFVGAAGELALRVAAQPGDRLVVAGGEATFTSDKGRVTRGGSISVDGPGEVVVAHRPGLVAVWLERNGAGPWKAPPPKALDLPQRVALSGEAMSFAIKRDAAAMLDIRANAPAIVVFAQNGRRNVETFAAGVVLRRYMAAGDATLEIYAAADGPLSGALEASALPITLAHEGLNDPVTLGAGGVALFSFETTREGEIGIGVRAEPDIGAVRLMDAAGKTLGEGVAQSTKLALGRYVVEARAPADAPTSVVRIAVLGVSPPPAAPPDEETEKFLELAGLKKTRTR